MLPTVAGGIKFKIFVRETHTDKNDSQTIVPETKFYNQTRLTGEKAKEFYESVLSSPPLKARDEKKGSNDAETPNLVNLKCTQIKTNYLVSRYKNSDLLAMAQNNDTKNIIRILASHPDFDINVVDNFGWTPLMCAVCNGAEETVRILLQKGADPTRTDNIGNTALQLARHKKFYTIAKLLENHDRINTCNKKRNEVAFPTESFYCDLCQQSFTTHKKQHEASILHVFNGDHKTSTFYAIPENNKGFQLLLKEGWNKERGLGPNGTGRKFPIKAKQKKNRRGIGAPEPSHHQRIHENDCISKYGNKKIRAYHKMKDKVFARNFRLEFHD